MTSYNGFNDNELIALLSKADQTAFAEIYHRYWKKMLLVAWNHTKDKSEAEDIVHEVFLSLWEKRNEVTVLSIPAFLTTCIKFTIFKYFQRKQKRLQLAIANYEFDEVSNDEENLDALFLKEYINGIVEQLPEKCQLTFKYSRYDGMTNAEIAEKMNISEKGVEANLTRALKVIRGNLKNTGLVLLLTAAVCEDIFK